jgi:energy-coupling factor transport system permease protein
MATFSALRHVSIGQYIATGSPVHRLDPRAKMIALAMLVTAAVIASSYAASIALFVLVVALVRLARLPLRYLLSSVLAIWPVLAVLALMQLLFYHSAFAAADDRLLWGWGVLQVSTASLRVTAVSLLRFLALLCLASLLTNTTPPSALTHGLERLLRPLEVVGMPAHEVATVGAIALRFLPILGEQMEAIVQAQEARQVAVESGGRLHMLRNARRLANLIVPLFSDAYRRAEELMVAMQARCYQGGRGRTHLHELRLRGSDFLALAVAAGVLAAVIVAQRLRLP